jgi:hypothetical protein
MITDRFFKWWALALLLILATIVTASALAQTIRWTPPTTWADGTPLNPGSDLHEYKLYCTPAIIADQTFPVTETEWVIPPEALPGSYDCHMTAVAAAFQGGLESAPGPSKTIVVDARAPGVVTFEVIP